MTDSTSIGGINTAAAAELQGLGALAIESDGKLIVVMYRSRDGKHESRYSQGSMDEALEAVSQARLTARWRAEEIAS